MTRRIVERNFDPNKTLLVRRAFSAAGRTFQQGDQFPWKRLSVTIRRTKLMFDAGMLMHSDEQLSDEDFVDVTETTETTETTEMTETTETTSPPAPVVDNSDLDVDSLVVLQAIAQREGAALKSTKAAQRQAIIDKRSE